MIHIIQTAFLNGRMRRVLFFLMALAVHPLFMLSGFAEDVDALLAQANKWSDAKNYFEAEQLLHRAVALQPENAVLHAALANVYLQVKNYSAAEAQALRAIEIDPAYDWPKILIIDALLNQNRIEDAEKSIQALRQLKGDSFHVVMFEGIALEMKKDRKAADEKYSEALKLEPRNVGLRERRAWNLRMQGDAEPAEAELQEALRIEPTNTRLLMALSEHYRARRYYNQAVDYLGQAVSSCGTGACETLEELYPEDFFSSTALGGWNISNQTIPVSVALSETYTSAFSNTENIVRGLQGQGADRSDENNLLSPKATPRNIFEWKTGVALPGALPLVNFYARYDQLFNDKDPTVEHLRHEYRIELEKTFHVPVLGDVTFFPYYKYSYMRGANMSIQEILGEDFKIDDHIVGIRNLIVPIMGKLYIETEYAHGRGNFRHHYRRFHEHYWRGKMTYVAEDTSRVSVESNFYMSLHNQIDVSDFRYVQTLEFDKFINEKLRLRTAHQLISHVDYAPGIKSLKTVIYRPEVGAEIGLFDNLKLKPYASYFIADAYQEYNHPGFGVDLVLAGGIFRQRMINNRVLPERMPWELSVGYGAELYPDLPKAKNKYLQTVSTQLKLFW